MDAERQRLIDRGANLLRDINLILEGAASWNENTRPRLYPDEGPIYPDPDGQLAKIKAGLERMLQIEAARGSFPTGAAQ